MDKIEISDTDWDEWVRQWEEALAEYRNQMDAEIKRLLKEMECRSECDEK